MSSAARPSASASSASPAQALPGGAVVARVTEIMPSLESVMYSRVRLSFKNTGPSPCSILSYTVRWGAGQKSAQPSGVEVPAGGSHERWLRVDPGDGDLAALTPASASVDVESNCAAPAQPGQASPAPQSSGAPVPADESEPPFGPPEPPALTAGDVCASDRAALDAVLKGYPKDVEAPQKGSSGVADLQRQMPRKEGKFGDAGAGDGYWGSNDVDGDGIEDLILQYEGIDFWSYLFFARRGGCFAFVGFLEGYQVQLVTRPAGAREARVYTYPNAPTSRIETYRWTGKAFEKKGARRR